MLRNKIYFITIAIAFLQTSFAFGQFSDLFKKSKDSYSTVGIGGGSSHYFGDLSPYPTFYYALYSNVRWNGTLNYQIHLNPRFSGRAAVSYIRLFGNDATYGWSIANDNPRVKNGRIRNLHFRNDLMEFTAMGLYTLIPMDEKKPRNSPLQWSPYVGIGIGISSNDPKARGSLQHDDGTYKYDPDGKLFIQPWESLRSSQNEDRPKIYSSIMPVFPIAVGVKARINQNWILALEGSLRLTFFDYLDDVGGDNYTSSELSYRADENYYALTGKSRTADYGKAVGDMNLFPAGDASNRIDRTGAGGSKGVLKDSYIVTQITLNYIITNRVKCPPIPQ